MKQYGLNCITDTLFTNIPGRSLSLPGMADFDIKYLENCILKLFKIEILFEMSFIFKVIVLLKSFLQK